MNAHVTSDRAARLTTIEPTHASTNANAAAVPHWPGDTQTRLVTSSSATMAPLVGLKTCLRLTRIANLPATARKDAVIASASLLVRSSRQSDSPEINALRAVDRKGAPRLSRSHAHCVASTDPRMRP